MILILYMQFFYINYRFIHHIFGKIVIFVLLCPFDRSIKKLIVISFPVLLSFYDAILNLTNSIHVNLLILLIDFFEPVYRISYGILYPLGNIYKVKRISTSQVLLLTRSISIHHVLP